MNSNLVLVKNNGTVVGWGGNDYGAKTPPKSLTNVAAIDAGDYFSVALKSDGTLVAWGSGASGEKSIPASLNNVVAVSAGSVFGLALKSNGEVVAWGASEYEADDYGQTTVPVGAKSGVVASSAGATHAMALKADGTVITWGQDYDSGEAIEETFIPRPSGPTNVRQISGGYAHNLAVKADSTVVGWGDDYSGQAIVPGTLSNVHSVAAGDRHSLALKNDGSVVAWGSNEYGQSNVPVGLNNVTAIAAGQSHSLALKSDRKVTAWGTNPNAQMTPPSSLANVVAIAAGHNHNLALVVPLRTMLAATPTVGGDPIIGQTLTANTGTWTSGTTLAYQWFRGTKAISGAISSSYTVTSSDIGSQIKLRVIGTKVGYVTTTKYSPATGKIVKTATPTIVGSPAVGSTLSVNKGSWSSGLSFIYQWFADGSAITGATKDKFTPTDSQADQAISVQVTGSRKGWVTTARDSLASNKVLQVDIPFITMISGQGPKDPTKPNVGDMLAASPGKKWTEATTFTYQWYADGKILSGQTGNAIQVLLSHKGKKLSVSITGSKEGYGSAKKSSLSTQKVTNIIYPPT